MTVDEEKEKEKEKEKNAIEEEIGDTQEKEPEENAPPLPEDEDAFDPKKDLAEEGSSIERANNVSGDPPNDALAPKKDALAPKKARAAVLASPVVEQNGERFAFDYETLRVKERVPLDYCHNDDDIVGYCENFNVSTDAGNAVVECDAVLLVDGTNGLADKIAYNLDCGVPYEASAFVDLSQATKEEVDAGDTAIVNGTEVEGPLSIYYNAELRGVAVCPHGADPATAFVALSGTPKQTIGKHGVKNPTSNGGIMLINCGGARNSTKNNRALELKAFVDEFGKEQGVDYYLEGKTLGQARAEAAGGAPIAAMKKELETTVKTLTLKIDALEKKLDALALTARRGDPVGVSEPREPAQVGAHSQSAVHRLAAKYRQKGSVRV